MSQLLRKCTAEFLGAFLIVLGGCGAVTANQLSGGAVSHLGVATSFGLIVMAMIYATGHISGAHFNPAVTIAFAIFRHFPLAQVGPYIAAQCSGAIAAALVLQVTLSPILAGQDPNAVLNLGVTLPLGGAYSTALIWEFLLTFFLMFVIMGVATDHRAVGQAAGIAIGATVWLEATFAGPICGASMNPARSLGPALVAGEWSTFSAYVIGPITGAIAGAATYAFVRCYKEDKAQIDGCC